MAVSSLAPPLSSASDLAHRAVTDARSAHGRSCLGGSRSTNGQVAPTDRRGGSSPRHHATHRRAEPGCRFVQDPPGTCRIASTSQGRRRPDAVGPGGERNMRELVYTGFMSLDGVVDSPGGGPGEEHRSGGWVFKDIEFLPEACSLKGEELAETTALMFGRRSYEAFAPTWRESEDHAAYKDLPKYVVSIDAVRRRPRRGLGPDDDPALGRRRREGSRRARAARSSSTAAPSWPAGCRTRAWSTGTTCWSSRCCSVPARACSATPTGTSRC